MPKWTKTANGKHVCHEGNCTYTLTPLNRKKDFFDKDDYILRGVFYNWDTGEEYVYDWDNDLEKTKDLILSHFPSESPRMRDLVWRKATKNGQYIYHAGHYTYIVTSQDDETTSIVCHDWEQGIHSYYRMPGKLMDVLAFTERDYQSRIKIKSE